MREVRKNNCPLEKFLKAGKGA